MKLWKDYKIQLLLMLLAFSQLFAYFYPGYAKGTSFILLQASLTVAVIKEDHYEYNSASRKH